LKAKIHEIRLRPRPRWGAYRKGNGGLGKGRGREKGKELEGGERIGESEKRKGDTP